MHSTRNSELSHLKVNDHFKTWAEISISVPINILVSDEISVKNRTVNRNIYLPDILHVLTVNGWVQSLFSNCEFEFPTLFVYKIRRPTVKQFRYVLSIFDWWFSTKGKCPPAGTRTEWGSAQNVKSKFYFHWYFWFGGIHTSKGW